MTKKAKTSKTEPNTTEICGVCSHILGAGTRRWHGDDDTVLCDDCHKLLPLWRRPSRMSNPEGYCHICPLMGWDDTVGGNTLQILESISGMVRASAYECRKRHATKVRGWKLIKVLF